MISSVEKRGPLTPGAALALVALVAGLVLASCKGGSSTSDNGQKVSSEGAVATINGTEITPDQFYHRLEIAAGTNVLQEMVNEELWLELAKKDNVLPSDGDVQAKYDAASKQSGFETTLRNSHQTPDDIKRGILWNMAREAVLTKGVTVSDPEVHAFYEANINPRNPSARYFQPEAVQVQIILTSNAKDIERAKHDLKGGATFESVAKAYSRDKSRDNGGLLPARRRGEIDSKRFPGLERTIFAMKPGQVVDNFRCADAIWIIRCVAHQPQRILPFEQVKDDCRTGARIKKGLDSNSTSIQSELTEFKKQADLKVNWPQYKDQINLR